MLRRRAWRIVISVLVIVAVVPALRQQARLQWLMVRWHGICTSPTDLGFAMGGHYDDEFGIHGPALTAHAVATAPEWVRRHAPEDPEMLMAAGTLGATVTYDLVYDPGYLAKRPQSPKVALALLGAAARKGNTPEAWSAYASALLARTDLPRLGFESFDPTDLEARHDAEDRVATGTRRETYVPELLRVLHAWQRVDPQNGLPVAYEAAVAYGLGRDAEALRLWRAAATRPVCATRQARLEVAARTLLVRMGVPSPEANAAASLVSYSTNGFGLRSAALMARYEAWRARQRGEAEAAFGLEQATTRIGQRVFDDASNVWVLLGASSVIGMGSEPAWRWHADGTTGLKRGPLRGGRLFHGTYHAWYVQRRGTAADAQLRDELVRKYVQVDLVRARQWAVWDSFALYELASNLPYLGVYIALLIGLLGLLFGTLHLPVTRPGDVGQPFRPVWRVLLALPVVLLAPLLLVVALLVSPFLIKRSDRWRRWRERLREVVPVSVAGCLLLYLAVGLVAWPARAKMSRWLERTNMATLRRDLRGQWEHPSLPSNAWYDGTPPRMGK